MRMSHVRLLLTACLLAIGAVVSPLGVGVALADPIADFDWAPKPVVAGAPVTLTSTSTPTDANTPITQIHWDLDGDRRFETRTPPGAIAVTVTAPAPGTWTVTMRVEDAAGEGARVTKEISVEAPPPPPPPPPDPPPPPPPDDPPPPPPDDPPPPPDDPPPPPPLPPPNEPPNAAFAALPGSPVVGEQVTLVSYSDDRDGRITEQTWDLNGDGIFDDATGPIATRMFSMPGGKTVTLRVTDDKGTVSTLSLTLEVLAQPAGAATDPPSQASRQPVTGSTPLPRI
jgi:PKD repeat protein